MTARWYLGYRLSYADLVEWLAERGIHIDPSTVYDWVRTLALGAPPRFVISTRR